MPLLIITRGELKPDILSGQAESNICSLVSRSLRWHYLVLMRSDKKIWTFLDLLCSVSFSKVKGKGVPIFSLILKVLNSILPLFSVVGI